MPARKLRNPFYLLLMLVGTVFVVTAFAYGLMAFQAVNGSEADVARTAGHPLMMWLRAHGSTALLAELGMLAVLTFAAIGTDSWWSGSGDN
jgi:hypothetical protein